MKKFLILAVITLFLSCSKDSEPSIDETHVSMKINGIEKTFIVGGRGITLRPDGTYELSINFYGDTDLGEPIENMYFIMRYKKKGTNVIEEFHCDANPNGLSANAVGSLLYTKVTINNRKQFAATLHGTMTDGTTTVEITDGVIEVVYDEPFDN